MSNLLERARASSLDRLGVVLGIVESGKDSVIEQSLRHLHAIKGEAGMTGLRALVAVVHALEEVLTARRDHEEPEFEDVKEALYLLREILQEAAAPALSEHEDLYLLADELAAISTGGTSRAPVVPKTSPPPKHDAPQQTKGEKRQKAAPLSASIASEATWTRIETRQVDSLAVNLSRIASTLDEVRSSLASQQKQESGVKLRELEERLADLRAQVQAAEEGTLRMKLLELQPLFDEMGRHLSDMGNRLGKEVQVLVQAQGVSLERGVVDALREPLLHLARNCVDHGLEVPEQRGTKAAQGTIILRAESLGAEVTLLVEDDGQGLDHAKLLRRAIKLGLVAEESASLLSPQEIEELIFLEGFSQLEQATELSGRGVGLSSARRAIEDLGGAIQLTRSTAGGCSFLITLPAAVAREKALVVRVGELRLAMPSRWVRSVIRDPDTLALAQEQRRLRLPSGVIPVRTLSSWFGLPRAQQTQAVVLEIAGRSLALLVQEVLGEEELIRTPADPLVCGATRLVASATLANGAPVFFLRWAEVLREVLRLSENDSALPPEPTKRAHVLVVDDSPVIREIVGNVFTTAGLAVTTAADGKEAWQHLQDNTFDLVVTDVEMPKMNGLQLLEAIRKTSQLLPVVILTTRSNSEHRREAALLGANAYVAKSEFHGETLMSIARRFVEVAP